ncbi:hypothetical protein MKO06_14560 [Gramella sp. GC03-9]|uniref:Uncharacterized protein n=1 Tax=Christiangramia oceanisediminis TaxID=2920386 RepID=A0A9X2KZC3_9FLAO|nr:hypothetical protein [Gramella oceanisediminis]MCP9201137.1 hypothetical protein [Gramella oceanisediminis]
MNNEEVDQRPERNKWNLILGILFIGYGSYRLYQNSQSPDTETFSYVLAIGFVLFGIYDLYKYFGTR